MRKYTEIHFEIEKQCLLNCKHCSSYSLRNAKERGYTASEAKGIIALFDDPVHIYLTGGEPLMTPNVIDLMRDLNSFRSSIDIGFFTCGIVETNAGLSGISYPKAQELKEAGLKDCYISVYHYDPLLHSRMTNQKDSMIHTVKTIENMLAAGIQVKVHLVINRLNIDCLNEIILYLSNLGVNEIRLLRLVYSGNAIENWGDIGISYSAQNEAIQAIFKRREIYSANITISGFPELAACRPFKEAEKCQGGTNVLYVTYEGNIYPCACTKGCAEFKIGHANEYGKIINYLKSNTKEFNEHCLNPLIQ